MGNKLKRGSISLETILVTFIMLPIFLSLILGSYSYYAVQSKNVNLNFETGRYVSTTGCSIDKLASTMPHLSKFKGYDVFVDGMQIQSGELGNIVIFCQQNSKKCEEFRVQTSINSKSNVMYKFFPEKAIRSGIYVQEGE